MTPVKKASTGPRKRARAVMAAAKSSVSSAASTAEAAAAAAKASAVSSAGWLARPVATAPSGNGPFFSSALRMFDARL
ncbi:hypothetical protein D3C72_2450070 [compost metagenome]